DGASSRPIISRSCHWLHSPATGHRAKRRSKAAAFVFAKNHAVAMFEVPKPQRAIHGSRGSPTTVRRQSARPDGRRVSGEIQKFFACAGVPKLQRRVATA